MHIKPSNFTHEVNTTNGVAKVAVVRIRLMKINLITVEDVLDTMLEDITLSGTL